MTLIEENLFAVEECEAKLGQDKLEDFLQLSGDAHRLCISGHQIDRAILRHITVRGGCPPYPTELMVFALTFQWVENYRQAKSMTRKKIKFDAAVN